MVRYADLVDLAFESHNPTWRAHKAQYASLVLARDSEQLAVAQERAAVFAAKRGVGELATRIELLSRFWLAEDYHQKYYLRNDRVLGREFAEMFGGDEAAIRESSAAARVNGYVAGDGTRVQLDREIDAFGLSEAGRTRLISRGGSSTGGAGCSAF